MTTSDSLARIKIETGRLVKWAIHTEMFKAFVRTVNKSRPVTFDIHITNNCTFFIEAFNLIVTYAGCFTLLHETVIIITMFLLKPAVLLYCLKHL